MKEANMNVYFIQGLQISAFVGQKTWQKTVPQKILLDIAWQSERIQATIQAQSNPNFDYEKFSLQIIDIMCTPHWDSLELFGAHLSQFIQTTQNTNWLKMTISIPHGLANMQALGMVIEQGEKR
jgi:FolB domain-containing protein